MRLLMTAFVFGIPETKMRCIAPYVGGGFGTKIFLYPEYVLMAALAAEARPAGQVDRDAQRELHGDDARPRPHHVHRRRSEAGRHDHGAEGEDLREPRRRPLHDRVRASRRRSTDGCCRARTTIPNIHCQVLGVYTNTAWSTPTAARDGRRRPTWSSAPSTWSRASSAWTRWRCGARTSSSRTISRTTRSASCAGSSTTAATMTRRSTGRSRSSTTRASGASRSEARAQGRYRGHRLLDLCRDLRRRAVGVDRRGRRGLGRELWESANVRVHLTGKVVVTTGSQPHGQGHETTFASRRRRAGDPDRGCDGRARRHAGHAVRLRHLRQPRGRRRCDGRL